MTSIDFARRRGPAVFAALLASGLLAACGSSSSTTTSASSGASASASASSGGGQRFNRSAFRQCLQQHGVTLPSRPPGGGSGRPPQGGGPGFFGGGGGALQSNPKLRAAVQACGGGNFRGGRRFQISHTAINNYVACVRQHGYNMPNPNFSGRGPVFPTSIRNDPKFQAASKPCQSLLFPARRGAGSGSSTGSSA